MTEWNAWPNCLYGILLLFSVWGIIWVYTDAQRLGKANLIFLFLLSIFWPVSLIGWLIYRNLVKQAQPK